MDSRKIVTKISLDLARFYLRCKFTSTVLSYLNKVSQFLKERGEEEEEDKEITKSRYEPTEANSSTLDQSTIE